MLNPGYKVIAKKGKIECNPGRPFICPICHRIILEAQAECFRIKCPHCRHWVYAEKLIEAANTRLDCSGEESVTEANKKRGVNHAG